MAKECVWRLTQDDKTCQKNKCEQYIKYKINEDEIKECVFITDAKLRMSAAGAAPIE